MSVIHGARSGGVIRIFFFNMKVCCVYTQHTIVNLKNITLNYPKYNNACSYHDIFFYNEFEMAVVNEPSMFEPLKFYCTLITEKSII